MNKVIAGRFSGRRIITRGNAPEILISRNVGVPIDRIIVLKLQVLNIEQRRKVSSGFLRGFFGKMLGSTMWLSAIQSAKSRYSYLCKLTYRDNTSSTMLIDERTFGLISTRVDIA